MRSVNITFPIVLILALLLAACGATSGPNQAAPTNTPEPDPPYAVIAAEKELGQSLGLPIDEIEAVSYEQVEWPDSCLGLAKPDEQCLQVITPGWRVVLRAEGQQYVFRTDQNGDAVRQES